MKHRRRQPLAEIGKYKIDLRNRTVDFTVKQSLRIRGIRLEIHNDSGLIVVVPKKYNQTELHEILNKKAEWILRHLPAPLPAQMPLFKKEIDHGERVPFMGKKLEVVVTQDGLKPGSATLMGNRLFVCPRNGVNRASILENWYREQAAVIFQGKAEYFQRKLGVYYKKITIRGQRKRWASASHLGTLSINWKLLLAPEIIIDYVIMHELAHFKHMNHSKQFWDFLYRHCPDWRKHREWLVTHEDELKSAATFGH